MATRFYQTELQPHTENIIGLLDDFTASLSSLTDEQQVKLDLVINSIIETDQAFEKKSRLHEWEQKKIKWLEIINNFFSIIPTLIGVGLIIFVFIRTRSLNEQIGNLKTISSYKDSSIAYKDHWVVNVHRLLDSLKRDSSSSSYEFHSELSLYDSAKRVMDVKFMSKSILDSFLLNNNR